MPKKLRLAQIVLIAQALLAFGVLGILLVYFVGADSFQYFVPKTQELFVSNPALGILTTFLFVFLIGAPIFQIVCAALLPRRIVWAYRLSAVLAALMLFSFPVGTICGVLILVGLFSRESREWFLMQQPVQKP